MIKLSPSKKYLIWGTRIDALRLKEKLSKHISIEGFVDNNISEKFIKDDIIYTPSEVLDKPYFFIIVATLQSYKEIRKQLIASEKKEFIDFVYYRWIGKKIAYLHGNCHMGVLNIMLSSIKEFDEKYAIYPFVPIQNNEEGFIDEKILNNLDVFIHQDIQKENLYGYKLSDEYIEPYLSTNCLNITVPNLYGYGKGFFPQFQWNNRNKHLNSDKNGMFPHADIFIDKCVKNSMDIDEIIRLIQEGAPFTEKEILDNFNLYMAKLRERQNNWDIPIYDFIQNNYQKQQLFYNQGHPTNIVMAEIAKQVLKKLNICGNPSSEISMDTHEEFVYPCVSKALSLNWKQEEIRKSIDARKIENKMDIREYVKEYIWWCY